MNHESQLPRLSRVDFFRFKEGELIIVLGCDNRNTPQHGSWLNRAEMELSVVAWQCLDRRMPDRTWLREEVRMWQEERNAAVGTVDWQFTTADARVKLKKLYPTRELQ